MPGIIVPQPAPLPGGSTIPQPKPSPAPSTITPVPGGPTLAGFPLTYTIPHTGNPSPFQQLFNFTIDMRWIVALIGITWSLGALEGYDSDMAWMMAVILLIGIAMLKGVGGESTGATKHSLKPSTKKGYQ